MHIWGEQWSKQQLLERIGDMSQIAGVRAMERTDGWERGNRCLEVRNGDGLLFHVGPDRGMDISYAEYRGVPLAWRSPAGDVSPQYYSPGGSDWLRSFPGGLFVTGGLDAFGRPSEDEGHSFGLHGRASSLPAAQLSVEERWQGDEYDIRIAGRTTQSALYGEHLRLSREIAVRAGQSTIRIRDRVSNEGFQPVPHMMLYHFNLGFPCVSERATLDIAGERRELILDTGQEGAEGWRRFAPPGDEASDHIVCHSPPADGDGWAQCSLTNAGPAGRPLRVTLRYDAFSLPYLYTWKASGKGLNILGLEPANCRGINGRKEARDNGTLRMLHPGEQAAYELEFCVEPLFYE